jgi:hypothetical protein
MTTSPFGDAPDPIVSPFGDAPDLPEAQEVGRIVGRDTPPMPEGAVLGGTGPALKGYMKDPELDAKAYLRAKQLYEFDKPGLGDRLMDAATLGISGPARGAAEWTKVALSGDPSTEDFNFGRAVDQYITDMRDEATAGVAGTAADVAGSLMVGGPARKIATGGKGLLQAMGIGGGLSAASALNNATEGDDQSIADVTKQTLMGAMLSGGLHGVGKRMATNANGALPHIGKTNFVRGSIDPRSMSVGAYAAYHQPLLAAAAAVLGVSSDVISRMMATETGRRAVQNAMALAGQSAVLVAPQAGAGLAETITGGLDNINEDAARRQELLRQLEAGN